MRTVRSKRANPGSRSTSFSASRAAGLRSGATASSRSKISVSAGESLALTKNRSLLAGTNNRLRRRRDITPSLKRNEYFFCFLLTFYALRFTLIRNRQSDHSLLLQLRQPLPRHSQLAAVNFFI